MRYDGVKINHQVSPMRLKVVLAFTLLSFAITLSAVAQESNRPVGHVAYVDQHRLWIKALPDGAVRQIAEEGATDPRWSASGQWLMFTQARNRSGPQALLDQQVIVPATAESQRTFKLDGRGEWSPTRDEIAFAGPDGLSIVRVSAGGLQTRIVLPQPGVGGFSWSQDGNHLAVSVTLNRITHLWTVTAQGEQPREIAVKRFEQPRTIIQTNGQRTVQSAEFDLGEVTFAGWSGDGHWILFWPNPDHSASIAADGLPLTAVPASGGVAQRLLQALHDNDVLLFPDFVSPSPRGSGVLVTAGGNREAWTNKRVTWVDPSTGKSSILSDQKFAASSIGWSRDGSRFACVLGPDIGSAGGGEPAQKALAQRHIWLMNADGKQPKQLTSDPSYRDEYPLWSRDGHTILFTRMNQQNEMSLWTADVASGTLKKVVDSIGSPIEKGNWFGYYGHLHWSSFYVAWSR